MDFERNVILVREAKGNKDRVVMLPNTLGGPLRRQIAVGRQVWECRMRPSAAFGGGFKRSMQHSR